MLRVYDGKGVVTDLTLRVYDGKGVVTDLTLKIKTCIAPTAASRRLTLSTSSPILSAASN